MATAPCIMLPLIGLQDELMFQTLLPSGLKRTVGKADPMPLGDFYWHGLDVPATCRLCWVVLLLILTTTIVIAPQASCPTNTKGREIGSLVLERYLHCQLRLILFASPRPALSMTQRQQSAEGKWTSSLELLYSALLFGQIQ